MWIVCNLVEIQSFNQSKVFHSKLFLIFHQLIDIFFYRENGLEPDLDSYTALLAIYGEAGDMESIMKVCPYFITEHVYDCLKLQNCWYTTVVMPINFQTPIKFTFLKDGMELLKGPVFIAWFSFSMFDLLLQVYVPVQCI